MPYTSVPHQVVTRCGHCVGTRAGKRAKALVPSKERDFNKALPRIRKHIQEKIGEIIRGGSKKIALYHRIISAEGVSDELRIHINVVRKSFMVLNREGLLTTARNSALHDTNRDPFSWTKTTGWQASAYFLVLQVEAGMLQIGDSFFIRNSEGRYVIKRKSQDKIFATETSMNPSRDYIFPRNLKVELTV